MKKTGAQTNPPMLYFLSSWWQRWRHRAEQCRVLWSKDRPVDSCCGDELAAQWRGAGSGQWAATCRWRLRRNNLPENHRGVWTSIKPVEDVGWDELPQAWRWRGRGQAATEWYNWMLICWLCMKKWILHLQFLVLERGEGDNKFVTLQRHIYFQSIFWRVVILYICII